MTTSSAIISNNRELVKYTVLDNKEMIETHVATRPYYNCPDRIIEKTIPRV